MKATRDFFRRAEAVVPANVEIPGTLTLTQWASLALFVELKYDEIRCAGASEGLLRQLADIDEAIADAIADFIGPREAPRN